jgi:hypothetical protein
MNINDLKPAMSIGEIEWHKYPASDKTLTVDEARIAMYHERSAFGSCVSSITPEGEHRVLVGGQWHRVVNDL